MTDHNKSMNPQRGQYDPGWNDPPMMQFNPTTQGSTNKAKLNKRIAFPITNVVKPTAIVQPSQSGLPLTTIPTQSSSQLPVAVVTPMPQKQTHTQTSSSHPTNRVPPLLSSTTSTINEVLVPAGNNDELTDENEVRDFCLNTFQTYLGNVIESTNVRIDEIQRRLNILSQMWLNNELDQEIYNKLLNIAKALSSNNFKDAIEYHRILVINHSNLCLQWAAALRHLILTLKKGENRTSESMSTGTDTTTTISSSSDNTSNVGNISIHNVIDNAANNSDNTAALLSSNSSTQSINSASNIQHI